MYPLSCTSMTARPEHSPLVCAAIFLKFSSHSIALAVEHAIEAVPDPEAEAPPGDGTVFLEAGSGKCSSKTFRMKYASLVPVRSSVASLKIFRSRV